MVNHFVFVSGGGFVLLSMLCMVRSICLSLSLSDGFMYRVGDGIRVVFGSQDAWNP